MFSNVNSKYDDDDADGDQHHDHLLDNSRITILMRTFLLECILNSILYCIVPYYTVLYPTILYYTILCCTILYYIVLYYTILSYVILHCIILIYLCIVFYNTIILYPGRPRRPPGSARRPPGPEVQRGLGSGHASQRSVRGAAAAPQGNPSFSKRDV